MRTARPSTILSLDGGDVFLDARDISDFDGPAFSDTIDISDFDEPLLLEMDDEPFDFEMEIVPVSADTIREIAATTIRNAQCALKQLAAEGIA